MTKFYDGPMDQFNSVLMDGIPRGTLCNDCSDHKGTKIFTHGDIFSIGHGHYNILCACCVVKRQLDEAEKSAVRLTELREKFKLSCDELSKEN